MSGAAGTVDIAANVARIRERIARAARRAGRRPEEIRLVAAAKQVEAARVREAIAAGIADIGENYVQEAGETREQVGEGARWHLIGHLQRNKAPQAAALFDMIQTVDSLRLATAIGRHAQTAGRTGGRDVGRETSRLATGRVAGPDAGPVPAAPVNARAVISPHPLTAQAMRRIGVTTPSSGSRPAVLSVQPTRPRKSLFLSPSGFGVELAAGGDSKWNRCG